MNATLLPQAVIDLGEGSPWPGIFGLITLVSLAVVFLSMAFNSNSITPRKDRPLRHVTTVAALVCGAAIICGVLTSNL